MRCLASLRAIESSLGQLGRRINKGDAAESVGRDAHFTPDREIGRSEDGVNTGWSGDSKLKRSGQLSWLEESDRQRESEDEDALVLQDVDQHRQIRGGDFG